MERLEFIEFRQQLLFDNNDVSRSIFEYGLTREQYKRIMDLTQDYRECMERGENCGHGRFNRQCMKLFQTIEVIITCVRNLQKDSELKKYSKSKNL